MTRKEMILKAIELLEEKKANTLDDVMDRRSYRTSVENLVMESITVQEKIQVKLDRLYKELDYENKKRATHVS